MKMTRRVAMKAGLVSAVSVLSPPALRADELQYQGKKGLFQCLIISIPLSQLRTVSSLLTTSTSSQSLTQKATSLRFA